MTANGKILYTTSSASMQSGAYRKMIQTIEGMANLGWDPVAVTPENQGQGVGALPSNSAIEWQELPLPEAKLGKGLIYYLRFLIRSFRVAAQLSDFIQRERIDIVHINEFYDLYAGIAAKMAGVRCVWHIRAALSQWPLIHYLAPRLIVSLADRVIVVSRSVEREVFLNQGLQGEKIVQIYNAEPGPEFHPGITPVSFREEFNIQPHEKVVTLVAKIREAKGHENFIRSAAIVLESMPETIFFVVGGELESPHHQRFAQQVKALPEELSIADRVIFTGYRSDIPQVMAGSDVLVHCSTFPDPFPGVVLQGMAVGKPIVASNTGGPKEQIEHGVSGMLCDPESPRALAQEICGLLGDGDRRLKMGQEAVRRVHDKFSADLFYNQISALYADLLTG